VYLVNSLGDEDAATLYVWAEVGTKVKIGPTLTGVLGRTDGFVAQSL
jgi:hypothetical protein